MSLRVMHCSRPVALDLHLGTGATGRVLTRTPSRPDQAGRGGRTPPRIPSTLCTTLERSGGGVRPRKAPPPSDRKPKHSWCAKRHADRGGRRGEVAFADPAAHAERPPQRVISTIPVGIRSIDALAPESAEERTTLSLESAMDGAPCQRCVPVPGRPPWLPTGCGRAASGAGRPAGDRPGRRPQAG